MIYLPQRFFSRDDRGSLDDLNEIFSRKGTFFIEQRESKQWIEEVTQMGYVMTNDPLKAMQFKTKGEAATFMVKQRLTMHVYEITEHEFVDALKIPASDPSTQEELTKRIDELNELVSEYKRACASIYHKDVDLQNFVEATDWYMETKIKRKNLKS